MRSSTIFGVILGVLFLGVLVLTLGFYLFTGDAIWWSKYHQNTGLVWAQQEATPTPVPQAAPTVQPTPSPTPEPAPAVSGARGVGVVTVPTGAMTSGVNQDNLDNVGNINPAKISSVTVDGQQIGAISTNAADPCVFYVAPGVGVGAKVQVQLFEGAAFAADADVFTVITQTLGIKNNSADVLIFADQPGDYAFTGSSFGLCVGQKADDNADRQINDRRNLDGRPMFWISPQGTVTEIGKDQ